MKKVYLILENGEIFEGQSFGVEGEVIGEVVFTTAMTGYLETLTDPSYYGQIVVQTFPLIGNYGVIPSDFESKKVYHKAYIVRDVCDFPSNFRSQGDLDTFLKENNVIGIQGIDVRKLTKIVRDHGVMNGMVSFTKDITEEKMQKIRDYKVQGAVAATSCKEVEVLTPEKVDKKVVLMDYGVKGNIAKELLKRNCQVYIMPHNTSFEDIMKVNPDGVMLSNGPGDPKENVYEIEQIKKLLNTNLSVFGICLGNQLLALAHGGDTYKLKYGHRGANQPVKDLSTSRVYITTQNHGYAVDPESLASDVAQISFINANDGTVEGVNYLKTNAFSVQFHPEACAGPLDTRFLFDQFIQRMGGVR